MSDVLTRLSAAFDGRYRIERKLGEGGMAVVYLAADLRHPRRVAIKVMKPEIASAVGAGRFLAEIDTTAKLQHPNVLALYDSGEADGLLFYVMPYVEGESLKERLDREGALPVEDALRIAEAVSEALEYAHRQGVIHRDIKPANVLLQGGNAVVSDFGIALAVGAAGDGRLTDTGLSLGTPDYMSPEQATGDNRVGPRSDIWAAGCLLYEMLVGEPPFRSETAQATLGRIVTGDVRPITASRAGVPASVQSVVRRALEKVPADRFASAADFGRALRDPGFRHRDPLDASATPQVRTWRWVSAALATVAVAALAYGLRARASGPLEPIRRFEIRLHAPSTSTPGSGFSVSADGSRIVFEGPGTDAGSMLWLRSLDELEPRPIAGTEGGTSPAISPDGSRLAFVNGGIRTVPLQGGMPSPVVSEPAGRPHWGDGDTIYFDRDNAVYAVPSTGGQARARTARVGLGGPADIRALPDGRGLLLTVVGVEREGYRIAVVGPEDREPREILSGMEARLSPSGHLLYTTAAGSLMAVAFDLDRLEPSGEPVLILEGVRDEFALTSRGSLFYRTVRAATRELVWVDRSGRASPIDSAWTEDFEFPVLSPDDRQLALNVTGGDVWVKRLQGGAALRLTVEGELNYRASWAPDGSSLGFISNRAGTAREDVWSKSPDGTGEARLVLSQERGTSEFLWSPDGSWLVYRSSVFDPGEGDLLAVRTTGTADALELVASEFRELQPTMSPDGRWLAYQSNETGSREVYVIPFPDGREGRRRISTGGGFSPVWSRAGDEIFFRSPDGDLMAVTVATEPTFTAGEPRALFDASPFAAGDAHREYDATRDGQRFVMIRPAPNTDPGSVILVENFLRELERLVN